MSLGLMYGNHTFKTWDSPALARLDLSLNPQLVRNAEMAFWHNGTEPNLHRKLREPDAEFAARCIAHFMQPQSTNPWAG